MRSQTSWKRFALALAAAGVVVAIALVVVAIAVGSRLEADRTYAGVLYASDVCSTGAQAVAPWLPKSSQLRSLRENTPPGSGLDRYGSVGVTVGDPPQLVDCAAL